MFDNILIDLVPTTTIIGGDDFVINSDFRIGIQYELLMQDPNVSNQDKLKHSIALFFYNEHNRQFKNEEVREVFDYISYFYSGGSKVVRGKGSGRASKKAIYSYDYDANYIYSDFMKIYNIDLQDIHYLHWWKFKALFSGLDEGSKLSKIMGYRAMKIDKDMSDKEKAHYRELKRIYRLPDNRTVEEKELGFHDVMAGVL